MEAVNRRLLVAGVRHIREGTIFLPLTRVEKETSL